VTGYWTWKDNTGLSMIVFESEDAANEMSDQVRSVAMRSPGAGDRDDRGVAEARARRRPAEKHRNRPAVR